MESTDGLGARHEVAEADTGSPITSGGRRLRTSDVVFNLLGQPGGDNKPAVEDEERWPIHRPAPSPYDEQQSTTEILGRVIVVDLMRCSPRAAEIGLFGGAGVGKTAINTRS